MDFLDKYDGFKLIITENKKEVIKYISSRKKLIEYKVLTFNEFRKKYYFDYTLESVYYLMNKYHIKYDIALVYLNNMIYLTKDNYTNLRLKNLLLYKKELEDNNLLIKDILFKDYLKNKNIIVISNGVNKFDQNMFNEVSNITNVYYHNTINPIYEHNVIRFNTIDEEVEYVAYKISDLIYNGVDINNIKITNIDDEYINPISRIFNYYNLKCDCNKKKCLYSTEVSKLFLNNITNDKDISLNNISKFKDNEEYIMILNILNELSFEKDLLKLKELLIYKFKHSYLSNNKYINSIEVIDYNNYIFNDNEYIFMLNFNNGIIPKFKNDEDFITDNLKDEIDLDLVTVENKRIKNNTINIIKSIKNLTITYKDKSYFNSYYPSNLIDEFNVIEDSINNNISYSKKYNSIKLGMKKDLLYKYGYKDKEYDLLDNNYEIKYNSYDNKFKGIDKNLLKEYLDNKLYLSYTSMDNYNKCAFKYYVGNLLNLNIYEETFGIFIGNLFHHVLEKCLYSDIDIDNTIDEFIKTYNRNLSKKESFYINKLRKDIKETVLIVRSYNDYISLDKYMLEKKIEIVKNRNLTVSFIGKIDKVLYKEYNDKTIMVLIDYKTYKSDINLDYIKYGINMQLPVYLYLASNLEFKNIIFGGFYLQRVSSTSLEKDISMYKLEGYSNSEESILNKVDSEYENSSMIKGMKLNNDGSFNRYAKVLDNSEINDLITKTDSIINEVIDNISNCKFDINPKKINDKDVSCNYCKFRDVCFRNEKDYVYLEGGEDYE